VLVTLNAPPAKLAAPANALSLAHLVKSFAPTSASILPLTAITAVDAVSNALDFRSALPANASAPQD
jgi:hypothetical protein